MSGYTSTLFARKTLTSVQSLMESILKGDWESSKLLLYSVCNENLSYSEAHVTEFINLWCDFCNQLVKQGDIKKLIPIFIELYVVGERTQGLDKVIKNI